MDNVDNFPFFCMDNLQVFLADICKYFPQLHPIHKKSIMSNECFPLPFAKQAALSFRLSFPITAYLRKTASILL